MSYTLGIVGAEAAKFTPAMERKARELIGGLIYSRYLVYGDALRIVSGKCHLGGIDIWAAEIGRSSNLCVTEHEPRALSWADGYKPRNILIARDSDELVCFAVAEYPPGFVGMTFPNCYHCNSETHIKSGGCWTMKYATKRGKKTALVII